MRFNVDRFRMFPELFKFTILITTILLMLSLAAASDQPPGTTFIWISCILAVIIDSLCIMAIGFEVEQALFPPHAFLNWALVECIFSSLFAINFFISIWLCVNSKSFSDSRTAYSLAATFCLANFVQSTMDVLFHVRIWIAEQRKAMHMEVLVQNPIALNVLNMMLSFSLLLALSSAYPQSVYGVLLFIGICSLSVSSLCVALLASNLQSRVAKWRIFQTFMPLGQLRWKHLQFANSLSLSACNWIGFLLNMVVASSSITPTPPHHAYYGAAFFSLALALSYLLTALTSLHEMSDDEDLLMKSGLVQKQQQKAQQYAEL